ncbi:MAG: type II toxin-antitoxin system RelE/ParE family toxin [Firmicutes bacterium]|nr:type II toxin-antitoxin system RelE/ParE family toxin [Bacillota bacterium]
MKKIVNSVDSEIDIDRLYAWIYVNSPKNALAFLDKIDSHYKTIGMFPKICMPLTNKIDVQTDLKYSISSPYVIITKHFPTYIEVYRVFHGKEDYLNKLF